MDESVYIISQSACAVIEALGMQAENFNSLNNGNGVVYVAKEFNSIIEKYGIHHNAVALLQQHREG